MSDDRTVRSAHEEGLMRLTVLGAGPAYTDREGSTGACYLVEHAGTHVLLDIGQGSFPRIFRHVPPEDVDAVVVSHLHPDHFIDLVPMRHYLRYQLEPSRRVRVLGPFDLAEQARCPPRPAGLLGRGAGRRTLGTGPHRVGTLTATAVLVTHTDESYAIRVAPDADGPASCTAATAAVPRTSHRCSRKTTGGFRIRFRRGR